MRREELALGADQRRARTCQLGSGTQPGSPRLLDDVEGARELPSVSCSAMVARARRDWDDRPDGVLGGERGRSVSLSDDGEGLLGRLHHLAARRRVSSRSGIRPRGQASICSRSRRSQTCQNLELGATCARSRQPALSACSRSRGRRSARARYALHKASRRRAATDLGRFR